MMWNIAPMSFEQLSKQQFQDLQVIKVKFGNFRSFFGWVWAAWPGKVIINIKHFKIFEVVILKTKLVCWLRFEDIQYSSVSGSIRVNTNSAFFHEIWKKLWIILVIEWHKFSKEIVKTFVMWCYDKNQVIFENHKIWRDFIVPRVR